MRLIIAAVGKMRAGPERALFEDYQRRAEGAGRTLGLTGPALTECEAPKNATGVKRQEQEGALLLKAAPPGAHIVAMDERGKNLTSEDVAAAIARQRDSGAPAFTFFIGGADGHSSDIKAHASQIWSFGAATWPHMLARVMLAEQIYRAVAILSGHPYHRS